MRASDVVVVGGGPAGLYAAWSLARAGCAVTLLEEHADIGEPVHCTGVLAKDAFEEFRLDTADILNQLTTVRFHAPSGHTIEYSTRSVEAVVIDRASFDRRLAREAVRAGVRLIHGRANTAAALPSNAIPKVIVISRGEALPVIPDRYIAAIVSTVPGRLPAASKPVIRHSTVPRKAWAMLPTLLVAAA